ncbi:MAG: ATP-binding protein [Clostridiales bacterium]|nr:ATP-binding protein [Clostridiales bacterium]
MDNVRYDIKILSKLMLKLLPVQILIQTVGAVNGIVSSYFATNYVGVDAMSAVGLYSPYNLLLSFVFQVLSFGSVILCGKYMGQNKQDKLRKCFTVNMIFTAVLALIFIAGFVVISVFNLTGGQGKDEVVQGYFNSYLLGQAIGILPLFIGNQLPAFLSLENKSIRSIIASIVYVAVNLVLNIVFIKILKLEAFGLALSSALGLWVFLLVQAQYFFTGKSQFKLQFAKIDWKEGLSIIKVGYSGALNSIYQTIRGFIVNWLLITFVGTVAISAFSTANNLLGIFWAIPNGMLAVSRMIMSVAIGEEDRRTLSDSVKVMLTRYLPIMSAVALLLTLLAEPLTNIFYHDPSHEVYMMTVWGIRILPWCMPLALITNQFMCYWQASSRQVAVHVISIIDGFICVCIATAVLISFTGANSIYLANVINGIVVVLMVVIHGFIVNRKVTFRTEDLLTIPKTFGAKEEDRMDITIRSVEDVVSISQKVQSFCEAKGVDNKRAMLAGLAMEEMAGNIVEHGFAKDNKKHSVDTRVVYKDGDVVLRLRDDCKPFDPEQRRKMEDAEDPAKNIGIRMVFKMSKKVEYQSLLGLNVLTIRI